MNSFAMCITLAYSLAEYSLEVQLKTFKHSIVDTAYGSSRPHEILIFSIEN